eukprot:scaffold1171_cov103-Skeletonema_dohrnii-CCMP3373.AAC.8
MSADRLASKYSRQLSYIIVALAVDCFYATRLACWCVERYVLHQSAIEEKRRGIVLPQYLVRTLSLESDRSAIGTLFTSAMARGYDQADSGESLIPLVSGMNSVPVHHSRSGAA